MPAGIDLDERLDAIAVATLDLTRDLGPSGVTVRAVAARLGGSTTLVTKYLPTRADLLANAFRYVSVNWTDDLAAAIGEHTGIDILYALARWSLSTENYDDPIRRLWIEALASGHRHVDRVDLPQFQARNEHERIQTLVTTACGESTWLADVLFLAFRGYYLSTIEDPERWPPDRARAAIEQLLALVSSR